MQDALLHGKRDPGVSARLEEFDEHTRSHRPLRPS